MRSPAWTTRRSTGCWIGSLTTVAHGRSTTCASFRPAGPAASISARIPAASARTPRGCTLTVIATASGAVPAAAANVLTATPALPPAASWSPSGRRRSRSLPCPEIRQQTTHGSENHHPANSASASGHLREATGLTRREFAESIGEYPGTDRRVLENNSLAGAGSLPKLALTLRHDDGLPPRSDGTILRRSLPTLFSVDLCSARSGQPLDAAHWPEEGALVVLSYETGLGGSSYLVARCAGGADDDEYPFISTDAGTTADDIVQCRCDRWMPLAECSAREGRAHEKRLRKGAGGAAAAAAQLRGAGRAAVQRGHDVPCPQRGRLWSIATGLCASSTARRSTASISTSASPTARDSDARFRAARPAGLSGTSAATTRRTSCRVRSDTPTSRCPACGKEIESGTDRRMNMKNEEIVRALRRISRPQAERIRAASIVRTGRKRKSRKKNGPYTEPTPGIHATATASDWTARI